MGEQVLNCNSSNSRSTLTQSNLISINIARGVASFSVYIYHSQIGQVLAHHLGWPFLLWLELPGEFYGAALFFMISGFCIHGSEWKRLEKNKSLPFDLASYGVRRFYRIYPLYFLALVFSCTQAGLSGAWPSGLDVGLHLLLLHAFSSTYFNSINLVLWSISIEACFYAIYPFWLSYRIRFGLRRAFIVGMAISLLSLLISYVFFYPYSITTQWFFFTTWSGWLLGALLGETIQLQSTFYHSWKWWILGLFLTIFCLWAETVTFYQGRMLILMFPLRILICAWPLSAIILSEKQLGLVTGIFKLPIMLFSWIGLFSYSLYLLHIPLITLRENLEAAIHPGPFRLVFQVVGFFLILFFSWLSYRYIELSFMKFSSLKKINKNVEATDFAQQG